MSVILSLCMFCIVLVIVIITTNMMRMQAKELFNDGGSVQLRVNATDVFYDDILFKLLNQSGDEEYRKQMREFFEPFNISGMTSKSDHLVNEYYENLKRKTPDMFLVVTNANIVCEDVRLKNPMIRKQYRVDIEHYPMCVLQIIRGEPNTTTRANLVSLLELIQPNAYDRDDTTPSPGTQPQEMTLGQTVSQMMGVEMNVTKSPYNVYPPRGASQTTPINSKTKLTINITNSPYGNGAYTLETRRSESRTLMNALFNQGATVMNGTSSYMDFTLTIPYRVVPSSLSIRFPNTSTRASRYDIYGSNSKSGYTLLASQTVDSSNVTTQIDTKSKAYRYYRIRFYVPKRNTLRRYLEFDDFVFIARE